MRKTTVNERQDRSMTKYSSHVRPSHELPRQMDTTAMIEFQGMNSKRYSFLAKAPGSPSRRPLTSKNAFGNAPQPQAHRQTDSRKYPLQERYDENVEKKHLSMTPTNPKNAQPVQSSKKNSFVSGSKNTYEQLSRYGSGVQAYGQKHAPKNQLKQESKKLDVTTGFKQDTKTPRSINQKRSDQSQRLSIHEFELNETAKKNEKYFEYIMRYSYRSKKGFIPNTQKFNQDAYIVSPNIAKKSWQHFFAICDGHGNNGHQVSGFIKNHLPQAVTNMPSFQKNPCDNLYKCYKSTMDKLANDSKIDLSYSGSTVVGCYMIHDKLYCANVGDSRAIIGRKDHKGNWMVQPISNDHKPSTPSEADRIVRCKGRIDPFKDPQGNSVGPLRVWLKDANGPGLAMTRSFGDLVAASVGVCWQPEIIQHTMCQNDRIILIASDGIWQFLQNDDIISKLVPFYESNKIEQACDFLLEYATAAWNKQCTIIDDISFIMIFMNYN